MFKKKGRVHTYNVSEVAAGGAGCGANTTSMGAGVFRQHVHKLFFLNQNPWLRFFWGWGAVDQYKLVPVFS
jgi:hypothetical protein